MEAEYLRFASEPVEGRCMHNFFNVAEKCGTQKRRLVAGIFYASDGLGVFRGIGA